MKIKKIIGFILAAALTLGSSATAFAADGLSAAQRDTTVPSYSWQYADVTASATVGGVALADSNVVLNAEGLNVTVVVPDGNTNSVDVTVSVPATNLADNSPTLLTGTSENVKNGDKVFMTNGDVKLGWYFTVLLVEEADYVGYTLNVSVEECVKGNTSSSYALTTARKYVGSSLDFNDPILTNGSTVMPGTVVYIDPNRMASCVCVVERKVQTSDTNAEINIDNIYEDYAGGTRAYYYFVMPACDVNFIETHKPTNKANVELKNIEHGTVIDRFGLEKTSDFDERFAEGRTVEYTLIPDEGYSAVMTVEDEDGNSITVTKGSDNKYTFEMPAKEVNVTIEFVEAPATDDNVGGSSGGSSGSGTDVPSTPTVIPSNPIGTSSNGNSSSDTNDEKEFKPVLPDMPLNDETKRLLSSITVIDTNGAFEDDVVMNVMPGKTANGFSFDITFTKDGKEVQPNGSVIVKVPVPELLKGTTIYVFHVENGKYTLVRSEVKDGFVEFTADHFSEYVLSDKNLADESESSDSQSDSVSTPTADYDVNPSTGIAVAAVPVMLAASAAVVVFKKKK
ncbi:MAG: hypothetical protein HDT43_04325 [Ruminococcaceae bacterium]|nr:hypothetical protein [Oscillospiraceae bacterium]